MSRSHKKGYIKDRPRNIKKSSLYWRRIRSSIKNIIRSCKDFENLDIPNPKTIVNDYDYCDYIIDYENYRGQDYFWYNTQDKYSVSLQNWIKKSKRK